MKLRAKISQAKLYLLACVVYMYSDEGVGHLIDSFLSPMQKHFFL